jgi:hypothetical protein
MLGLNCLHGKKGTRDSSDNTALAKGSEKLTISPDQCLFLRSCLPLDLKPPLDRLIQGCKTFVVDQSDPPSYFREYCPFSAIVCFQALVDVLGGTNV